MFIQISHIQLTHYFTHLIHLTSLKLRNKGISMSISTQTRMGTFFCVFAIQ